MRKQLLILAGILLLAVQLYAQSRIITGTVTDEVNGTPLAGVSVTAGQVGVQTNEEGKFSISIPSSIKFLNFSFVGYADQRIAIGTNTVINVSLKSGQSELQEVVVVGYGTQKKSDVTASIASVKGASVADKPVQSFDAALGGRAAGVQITVPNGVLNNPPVFRIRGTNSLSLSSYPLIVVDGVPSFTGDLGSTAASTNALSSINPADIESLDILKDAAATAIYGSRAANGVVVITTKKGKKGKSKVTYDGWAGWTKAYRLWDLLNADQYMEIKNEGRTNMGQAAAFLPFNGPDGKPVNTNWYDFIYQTGFSHGHTVSVSGANDATSYYVSAGYTRQEGIIKKNTFDRKTLRANLDHKIGNIVSVGINVNYANDLNKVPVTTGSLEGAAYNTAGLGRLALILPTNISAYNNDGTYNVSGAAIGSQGNTVGLSYPNPAVLMDNGKNNTENSRIQGNIYLQVKPLKDITLRTVYGIDYLSSDNDIFGTPLTGDYYPDGGAYGIFNKRKRWVWSTTAQYDHTFAERHSLHVLAGTEQAYTRVSGFGLYREGVSDDFFTVLQGGWNSNDASSTTGNLGENYLVSGFGRLNYDFAKRYFIGGSIRRDGYSAFAPGKKYGNFWSVSAGWDIANESFWANSSLADIVSSFKLRGSYGTVGNTAGIDDYASFSFFDPGLYNGNSSLYYNQSGNVNLTWETSKKTDIGFNFSLFGDRVTGELAWYKNDIDGLIIAVPQSASTGIPGLSILQNVGTMYNKGVELSLGATPIHSRDFRWTTSFNITSNKNRVTSLAPGVPDIKSTTGSLEETSITLPGYSVGTIYVLPTAGVDPASGKRVFINKAGDELLFDFPTRTYSYRKDGTPAPAISAGTDKVPFANSIPRYYGGFDNTIAYKNFDLNILFTYQGGFYVYNGTQATIRDNRFWNSSTDVLKRWQKQGDITDIPKIYYGDNISNGSANPISDNVQKGDFIRLKNLSIGYSLAKDVAARIGFSNLRIYVSGQNLALITKYKGSDPEISSNGNNNLSQGVERNSVANGRVLTVGLSASF
ncbi:MAG: TonB-dependent receptor [Agriterribacter sp.]